MTITRTGSHDDDVRAKWRTILDGARQVFGQDGYERASVDRIAASAGVSKATVYRHFKDKQTLFIAVVVDTCDDMRDALERALPEPGGDVEEALRTLGERVVKMSLSPSVIALHRQTIGEAQRIPGVGRMVYERGTSAIQELVAAHLLRWANAGALAVADAWSAAIDFVALCRGDLLIRARLEVLESPFDGEVSANVRRAVRVFMRGYGP
jgi:AcrR family transcriptional regulator